MSVGLNASSSKFRQVFRALHANKNITNWFPGHMHKGMQQMQRILKDVDCIIEVHDARIPFSGRNPNFYSMLSAIKPHILVLNKTDLADLKHKDRIVEQLMKENITNVIFTDCKKQSNQGISSILSTAVEMMRNSERYHRSLLPEYQLMVIGVPNVGKSSLINRLRNNHMKKKKANPVGALPGITRSVLEKVKIFEDPLVYLFDTPGVIQPHVSSLEVGMRLALCRTLNDHLVGPELIADYLLYWMNKHGNFKYVKYLEIPDAVDDIRMLLIHAAKSLKLVNRIKNTEGQYVTMPNFKAAAEHFLKAFRNGEFGKVMLDDDIVNMT